MNLITLVIIMLSICDRTGTAVEHKDEQHLYNLDYIVLFVESLYFEAVRPDQRATAGVLSILVR